MQPVLNSKSRRFDWLVVRLLSQCEWLPLLAAPRAFVNYVTFDHLSKLWSISKLFVHTNNRVFVPCCQPIILQHSPSSCWLYALTTELTCAPSTIATEWCLQHIQSKLWRYFGYKFQITNLSLSDQTEWWCALAARCESLFCSDIIMRGLSVVHKHFCSCWLNV